MLHIVILFCKIIKFKSLLLGISIESNLLCFNLCLFNSFFFFCKNFKKFYKLKFQPAKYFVNIQLTKQFLIYHFRCRPTRHSGLNKSLLRSLSKIVRFHNGSECVLATKSDTTLRDVIGDAPS